MTISASDLAKGLFLLAAMAASAPAQAQCRLCAPSEQPDAAEKPTRPLQIEVIQPLNFDRLALDSAVGSGTVSIEPTGGRTVSGQVVDLGGMALSGKVRLVGEPGRTVRVEIPSQVTMLSPGGSDVPLTRIKTNLPPSPRLGPDGTLEFNFGGQLMVTGSAEGNYRGRIPIDAFYE